jgi:hypothetical protein
MNKQPATVDDLSAHGEALLRTFEEMKPNPDNQGWHLDKKVPITLILALLMQAAGGLWFIADLRKDVELLKSQQAAQFSVQRDRDERQDRQQADSWAMVRGELQNIQAKLDRLIEKRAGK